MEHVLAAVSDVLLADGMSRLLTSNALICDVVHDGLAADRFLREKQVDVVITDVDLPGLSGFELLGRLRLRNNGVPVILLSVKNDSSEWIRGMELGATDLLYKPFEIVELIRRIEALLRRKNPVVEQLQCGNLVLDEKTKLVCANSKEFTISPLEWAILKFMVGHAGKVISKQQLSEAIFPPETTYAPNTIEVHISRIRPKLRGTNAHIRTVRGYGYMMETITSAGPPPPLEPEPKQIPIP